jgi:1-phosphatidylinositol-4-phosphate 5-kinase
MYRVKLYHLRRNVKFIIMNSVYYTDKLLHQFYDLKGSKAGRNAKPGQDVLKDNDLRKRLPEEAIILAPDVRERLREQIVLDCDFLRTMKIMDYSLLVGVHRVPFKRIRPTKNIAEIGFKLAELLESHRIGQAAKSKTHRKSWRVEAARSQRSGEHQHDDDGGHGSDYSIDDDDDSSYLDGSEHNARYDHSGHVSGDDSTLGDRSFSLKAEIEIKKEQTVERIYWPFHRLYDIHGHRRLHESPCVHCGDAPCTCHGQKELRQKLGIPDFVPPLSSRKDGGLMMDTTDFKLPLKCKGPQGDQLYEGKIFYMGIIDILQQYNVRKRVESRYRKVQGSRGQEPSCTHPNIYADRFVSFFDEYSQLHPPQQEAASPRVGDWDTSKTVEEEKEEIDHVRGANDNPFEVEFSPR